MINTVLLTSAVLKGSQVRDHLGISKCPTIPTTITYHKKDVEIRIEPIKQGKTKGNIELHRNTIWSYYKVSIYKIDNNNEKE